jgi:hypothetical protein
MIDENDIAIASTDVLIQALKDRHPEGCIIAIQHPQHEIRSSGNDWRICFKGDKLVTLKLASLAVWMHQQEFMKGMEGDQHEDIET